ncbi:D-alanine--D-alanine ligase [bacterium 210820-DFI.6.52]|nr:D-alanine--D-alanine ligase [bacterium 210820-DFI.6.52]
MSRIKLAVLFGGVSSEYEVSLQSAYNVLQNIPQERYEVFPVGITKSGRWLYFPGSYEMVRDGSWKTHPDCVGCSISPDRSRRGIVKFLPDGTTSCVKIDAAFPVLHGKNGEDGTVQGLLDLAGIPYVGCGVLSSACCMDKVVTKVLLEQAGIQTAPFLWFSKGDIDRLDAYKKEIVRDLGYPCFVKPANAGSSVGITKVKREEELRDAVLLAFTHDDKVLVEKAMAGQEVECAVLGNRQLITGIPGEILSESEFYDYDAKYVSQSPTVVPARLSPALLDQVQETAKRAFAVLGCTGLSRIDFFVGEFGICLNEINTLPGFTSISMYSKMMEAAGIPYGELLDRLVDLALERAAE